MCGIGGIWRWGRADVDLVASLCKMSDRIAHRGPDGSGMWIGDEKCIGFVHRRLAIVDLSDQGAQPMRSCTGRYVVTFNGEIYNHGELRRELAARGAEFLGHSDTEVALAAFEAWGIGAALERFAGMFAFGIWDEVSGELLLARDRIGKKPLYYATDGDGVAFASRLDAIEHLNWVDDALDLGAIASVLAVGYVAAPKSILRGICKVPPGGLLRVRPHQPLSVEFYWPQPADAIARRRNGSYEDWRAEVEKVLLQAVRERMVADVPIGAFLSGGVDSTAVVALMQASSTRPVNTFTVGFGDPAFDEAPQARRVAALLGTQHTDLYVSESDLLQIVPRLTDIYDEPFGDPSAIPTCLLAQVTRRHVSVALSGDGGDEVFGGYNRHAFARRHWPIIQRIPLNLRRVLARGIGVVSPDGYDRLARLLASVIPRGARVGQLGLKLQKYGQVLAQESLGDAYATMTRVWPDANLPVNSDFRIDRRRVLSEGSPSASVREMMRYDMETYLPDDVLVKVDRATMAVALEARAPLLDHRVIDLMRSVPEEHLFNGGRSKAILRDIAARYVPESEFRRPKNGFAPPIETWLRGPLKGWAEDLLSESRLRRQGLLDPEPIRRYWAELLSGRGQWQYAMWSVLMLQSWMDRARSGRDAH